MKAQCDKCREIVALEFAVATGGIDVHCPSCKASYFVAARARPAGTLPNDFTCPKCGEPQGRGEACKKCGLVFAKWRGPDQGGEEADPEAAVLFARCEEKWEDGARHDAFIGHARRSGAWGFAAARYRAALARAPEDAVAAARLKQIRSLAEFVLRVPEKNSGASEPIPYRNTMIVLTVIVALCIAGAIVIAVFGIPGMP